MSQEVGVGAAADKDSYRVVKYIVKKPWRIQGPE